MPETATDPLILAAEQADAEAAAAEAEALAAQASATAARARARAAKLRREAGERTGGPDTVEVSTADEVASPAEAGTTEAETARTSGAEAAAVPGETAGSAEGDRSAADASATVALSKGAAAEGVDVGEGASAGVESEDTATTGAGAEGGTASTTIDSAGVAGESADPKTTGAVAGGFSAAVRRVKPGAIRRPGRRTVGRAVVAVIVLVSLVAGGYSIWNHHQLTADQAREDEFLNAAREGVIALTTLDSGRAADDVKRVLDHSTGAFRTDFQTRSQDFTKVVEQSAVATQGEITAAAVESMTDESAVVLVSAVSRVTNSAGAQQEPRVWRLSVTVTREGSELKMSKVEFVP
ncbi:hypothetical protein [Nocardia sp. CA-290969]|uniref:hypothetical protein n=1 Tax=Nocardia sp. CA-290969 TaxID=3239986 RepID=UPI003D92C875